MANVDYGMGLRVAERVADPTMRAVKELKEYNAAEAVSDQRSIKLDLEIAQRLVDNATVLLEQAKIYRRRLKAQQRAYDRA